VASVISFPLTIESGTFGKVQQGSDAHKAQQVSSFVKTEVGERPLFDEFGISDPSFDRFDAEGFTERFQLFYKSDSIRLRNIEIAEQGGAVVQVNIEFE
jgi:hypothetical protein